MFAGQGFVIPLSRFAEPFFFQILGNKLKNLWKSKQVSEEDLFIVEEGHDKEFVENAARFSRQNLQLASSNKR